MKILTIDELRLPKAIHELSHLHRGLVLVTGMTGSGKSTTLAAMINEVNETKKKHIITIEDPIEFVHKDKEALLSQHSIGQDSLSFSNALKASLREDPDIILVGEMRDLETIEIALHAANTGHLVFSTLHTLDAKETINRIIGMFPKEGRISRDAVLENATNPSDMKLKLQGIGKGVRVTEEVTQDNDVFELKSEEKDEW